MTLAEAPTTQLILPNKVKDGLENGHLPDSNNAQTSTILCEQAVLQLSKKEEIEAEQQHQTSFQDGVSLALAMLALSLATFLIGLDATIIGTVTPIITNAFDDIADVGWYGSAYSCCFLTACSFQPTVGKLFAFLPAKWLFIAAIAVFELGSIISATALSPPSFIFGRSVSGLGCTGVIAGSMIIITHIVPMQRRPVYVGIIGALEMAAQAVGPLLGGALATNLNWRWCFYINLPIGGIAALLSIFFIKNVSTEGPAKLPWRLGVFSLDFLGVAALLPALVCFLLALRWGGVEYTWGDPHVVGIICASAAGLGIFVIVEYRKGEQAALPLGILRNRTVALAALMGLAAAGGLAVLDFYLPIWFQGVKGVSAQKAGIMLLPLILSMLVALVVVGHVTTLVRYYNPAIILGGSLLCIGSGLLVTLTSSSGAKSWISYQCIIGIGAGLAYQQPVLAVQNALPASEIATGTTVIVFAQTLGSSVFISIAQAVFLNDLNKELRRIPGLNLDLLSGTGATDFRLSTPIDDLDAVIAAYNNALVLVYYISLALSALYLFLGFGLRWTQLRKEGGGEMS